MKKYSYDEIEMIYEKISPFEFKDKLIDLAKYNANKKNIDVLDAGRGNPNWIAATPREAFFTFGQFAVNETRLNWNLYDISGMPKKEGIYDRFNKYIKNNNNAPGIALLENIIGYGINTLGFNPDDFIYELTDAIIGDNYPVPDRMLTHIEKITKKYLVKEMKYDVNLGGEFDVFAVEGATAGMCYTFDSLFCNNLLKQGDKIALMTPIFTPYLEIPHLPKYNLNIVDIVADEVDEYGNNTWQYSKSQLDKLKDKSIKALFVVNPNNPGSVALNSESVDYLVDIVNNFNKDLMIVSDDVYGTFINNFSSLMSKLPYNTLGIYSYSKYFGVTGWRLGTMALHNHNIFDKIISELDLVSKAEVDKRYKDMTLNPSSLSFMDRVVADSRSVSLNHTAGLSTPQQVQMAFLSAFSLLDKEDNYRKLNIDICNKRYKLFYNALQVPFNESDNNTFYYTQFNILNWAETIHSKGFANYINENYSVVNVLYKLANDYSIVLLSGAGFSGPKWSVRVSLANLPDEAYYKIGKALNTILNNYVLEYNNYKTTNNVKSAL